MLTHNHEASSPQFDLFAKKDLHDSLKEPQTSRIRQANKKDAAMRSWLEFSYVGEVKILRDQKPSLALCRRPDS